MDKEVDEVTQVADLGEVEQETTSNVLIEPLVECEKAQEVSTALSESESQTKSLTIERPSSKEQLNDIIGFFTRPMFSKKKTDELKKLAQDADAIHKRMDAMEVSIKDMGKASAQLQKKTGKALSLLFKEIEKNQLSHQGTIERIISELKSDFAAQTSSSKQFQTSALSKVDDAAGTIQGVNGALSGIRSYLDENGKIVKRFEEGYDYQMLKNFVREIARTISNLERYIQSASDSSAKEELIDARDDMVELLERNSVDQIIPKIGEKYSGNEKYWELTQDKEPNHDPSRRGHVARVDRTGYIYEFNTDQERVILAARVVVFA